MLEAAPSKLALQIAGVSSIVAPVLPLILGPRVVWRYVLAVAKVVAAMPINLLMLCGFNAATAQAIFAVVILFALIAIVSSFYLPYEEKVRRERTGD